MYASLSSTIKTYLVGGAVRDHLLNIQSNDLDYVILGFNNYSDFRNYVISLDIDIKVDIIKGRFMFMSKSLINNITLENEETCEDIKVSSYSNYKLIPGILKNRLINLDELEVGLFGSSDHNLKRSIATKRYFKLN
jgi:hypothetical protein